MNRSDEFINRNTLDDEYELRDSDEAEREQEIKGKPQKCSCGRPLTEVWISPNPSVPVGGVIPKVDIYPTTSVKVCDACDKNGKFKDTFPSVHAFLNRFEMSPEERMYRFGFTRNEMS